jgi:p-aminobenzoyl-glutamate transporter AbgT
MERFFNVVELLGNKVPHSSAMLATSFTDIIMKLRARYRSDAVVYA